MAAKPSEQAPSDGSSGARQPGDRDERWTEDPSGLPPVPVLSPLLARRLSARVLDPETVALAPGQPVPLPTVYVSDTILVRDVSDPELDREGQRSRVEELKELAEGLDDPFTLQAVGTAARWPLPKGAADTLSDRAELTVTRVRLERRADHAARTPDAWRFLQTALLTPSERGAFLYDKLGLGRLPDPEGPEDDEQQARRARRERRGRSMASGVTVEHVLTAGGGVWGGGGGVWGGGGGVWGGGGGVWGGGGGVWGGGGGLFAEYGAPGIGGRTPVVWSAPDPRLAVQDALPADPPVVAILDTGLGQHAWFPPEAEGATADQCPGDATCPGVHRKVVLGTEPIGVWKEPSRDPENTGVIIDDVNGLVDVLCGHGTFIAGIVRQRCPEAVILSVPVMASDGAALEEHVIEALTELLARHRAAKDSGGPAGHGRLDVVNLSLGYYHETPDEADDSVLHDLLREFADEGVVVVACAGNDATRARFFPAAFATPGDTALVGVGATNPADRSVALFSNVGEWVTVHAPGAGVVSTVPQTLSGSLQPVVSVTGVGPGARSGIDPDDFRSGFAVWSGTSFAAPWVAGEIAREIVRPDPAARPGGGTVPTARARAAAATVVAKANLERFGPPEEES